MWLSATPTRLINLDYVSEITVTQVGDKHRIDARMDGGILYLYECDTEKAAAKMVKRIKELIKHGD